MEDSQREKLEDYIIGLRDFNTASSFPMGAVLMDEADRAEVVRLIKRKKLPVLEAGQGHPDLVLGALIDILKKGKMAILNLTASLDPKLLNQLHNMANDQINAQLVGETNPAILNPIPQGSKLVLLMSKDYYENLEQQDMITSVCQI